jgi:hypothetical protein
VLLVVVLGDDDEDDEEDGGGFRGCPETPSMAPRLSADDDGEEEEESNPAKAFGSWDFALSNISLACFSSPAAELDGAGFFSAAVLAM